MPASKIIMLVFLQTLLPGIETTVVLLSRKQGDSSPFTSPPVHAIFEASLHQYCSSYRHNFQTHAHTHMV